MTTRTIIIAEAGVNHNGDISVAKRLIEEAAKAGADFVKFQTFDAARQVTNYAKKTDYQIRATNNSESQYAMLKKLELTHEMHVELIEHCAQWNINFLSTGFDIESVDYLVGQGIEYIKIPSGELTNLPYLRHVGRLGKKIILSTGLASFEEIKWALEILGGAGTTKHDITVLHCTSLYPTPMEFVNLEVMTNIKNTFEVKIGYSDHTLGIEISTAAVALGATIIEKHLTLDCAMEGPDHGSSLQPDQFSLMVSSIRNLEIALGDGIKSFPPELIRNKKLAEKSIVANRVIKRGEILSSSNITTKRPGTGMSPRKWDQAIGSIAKRDFEFEEMIEI